MAAEHSLKSPWTLLYLPAIDRAATQTHGSYDNAYKALLKVVGKLTTVEGVCSTFNSLPKISAFPQKDFIILTRNDRQPKYEAFESDARKIVVDAPTEEASKNVLELLLAAVLGNVLEDAVQENPCHVLRMSHRPGFKTPNAVRFEVWMDNPKDAARVKSYFEELLGFPGCKVEENPLNN